MIVKAIYKPDFGDITTGDTYDTQVKRKYGDIFECDDQLAEERIRKGLVKKATKKEEKEYMDGITTNDSNKIKSQQTLKTGEQSIESNEENEIKALEDCTIEELIQIGVDEDIELHYPEDDTAKDVIIEIINKAREERLNINPTE